MRGCCAGRAGALFKSQVCLAANSVLQAQPACVACTVAKVPAHSSASRLGFQWTHTSSITLAHRAGVLEALSAEVAGLTQQCEADPSPAFYKQARMLVSLAATLNKALLNIPKSEVYLAAWRCLLPACMEAGALAGADLGRGCGGFCNKRQAPWRLANGTNLAASSAPLAAAGKHSGFDQPPEDLWLLWQALVSGGYTVCGCARVGHRVREVEQRVPCI